MNPSKSVRSDVPSIRLVKFSTNIICSYLSKLYNNCVEYDAFPNTLKNFGTLPINKNGKNMM